MNYWFDFLPIAEATKEFLRLISMIMMVISSMWIMWRNNSFSREARLADEVMEEIPELNIYKFDTAQTEKEQTMRLIDADKMKDILVLQNCYNTIIDVINEQPIVDVAKAVRCADCKWFKCNARPDGIIPKGCNEYSCENGIIHDCDPTDFCPLGERRRDV